MAELPDLTVFANILTRRFKNQTLRELDITQTKKLNISAQQLKAALVGKKLVAVTREGKTLQFHFAENNTLGLHLMLRGELVGIASNETPKYQIMAFRFDNGDGFAVVDILKQATPTFQPKANTVPDALGLSEEYFNKLLAKKRSVIKILLMDQKALRGIGNTYADEILYDAGVSPFSIASAIPPKQVNNIYNSIRITLEKAIRQIGETNGDELNGELRDFLDIHNPHLQTTPQGHPIKTEKIGGRTTYYTEAQEIFS